MEAVFNSYDLSRTKKSSQEHPSLWETVEEPTYFKNTSDAGIWWKQGDGNQFVS